MDNSALLLVVRRNFPQMRHAYALRCFDDLVAEAHACDSRHQLGHQATIACRLLLTIVLKPRQIVCTLSRWGVSRTRTHFKSLRSIYIAMVLGYPSRRPPKRAGDEVLVIPAPARGNPLPGLPDRISVPTPPEEKTRPLQPAAASMATINSLHKNERKLWCASYNTPARFAAHHLVNRAAKRSPVTLRRGSPTCRGGFLRR